MFLKNKKNWIGRWVFGIRPIRVFLRFLDFFQLDKTPRQVYSRFVLKQRRLGEKTYILKSPDAQN